MGKGKRVQIDDGEYEVYAVQPTTFPTFENCLQFDIPGRNGLTPFLTDESVETGDVVSIQDMAISNVN